MATISVTGLASLDLSRLSLSALSNPANYSITEVSNSVLSFRVGTEFSYRLTGTNLFSIGAPGSTITSLRVTFGATTFNVDGINLDFFTLFQGILSSNPAAGFTAYLTGNDNVLGGDLADDISDLVGHNRLDLDLRQQIDDVLRAAVNLCFSTLAAKSFDLVDSHAVKTSGLQRIFHIVDFVGLDDCSHKLHIRHRSPFVREFRR